MHISLVPGVGASALGLAGVASTAGYPVCRPKLIVTDVQFSEMIPPTFERTSGAVLIF